MFEKRAVQLFEIGHLNNLIPTIDTILQIVTWVI